MKEIEIFTFAGKDMDGPSFTILGAVHGNEKCGPIAINRLLSLLNEGTITIKSGVLTCIPICNPRAYRQNVRFVERNLNRFMYPKEKPQKYEDYLDNQICPILNKTDYLLDLHSYTSRGEAFVFLGQKDQRNIDFAKSLSVPRFIYGWAEALSASDDVTDKRQAMGTTEYTREHGGVGITLECGTHDYDRAADVGFEAILGALEFLGMADIPSDLRIRDLPKENCYNIKMKGAHLKTKSGDFTREWNNMEPAPKGTKIAAYDDGEDLVMPEFGYIVLPKRDAAIGHEWFFWGVEEPLE